jgi:hypothetical protein
MAYFQTKNPDLGTFLRVLQLEMLVYYLAVWSILRLFGMFLGHLVYFMIFWYIFPVLVCFTKKNLATLLGSAILVFASGTVDSAFESSSGLIVWIKICTYLPTSQHCSVEHIVQCYCVQNLNENVR